jgi:hypothetical protein
VECVLGFLMGCETAPHPCSGYTGARARVPGHWRARAGACNRRATGVVGRQGEGSPSLSGGREKATSQKGLEKCGESASQRMQGGEGMNVRQPQGFAGKDRG